MRSSGRITLLVTDRNASMSEFTLFSTLRNSFFLPMSYNLSDFPTPATSRPWNPRTASGTSLVSVYSLDQHCLGVDVSKSIIPYATTPSSFHHQRICTSAGILMYMIEEPGMCLVQCQRRDGARHCAQQMAQPPVRTPLRCCPTR